MSPEHNHDKLASSRDQKSANKKIRSSSCYTRFYYTNLWVNDRLQIRVSYGVRSANWNGNSKVVAKPTTTSERWDISRVATCEVYSIAQVFNVLTIFCRCSNTTAKTWCTAFIVSEEWLVGYWICNFRFAIRAGQASFLFDVVYFLPDRF